MHALRSPSIFRRHVAWLVWLALLLPLAQATAAWHVVSHAGDGAAGEAGDQQPLHAAHCDLCLTAAALGGAAPPSHLPAVAPSTAVHQGPYADAGSVWVAAPLRAYLSRAPPFVPH